MADLWGPLYALSDVGAITEEIDPRALGVSDGLVEQLLAWAEDWVDVTGQTYGRIRDERTLARLRRTGARLATVLKRELGDEYEVLVVEVPVKGAPEAATAEPVL